MGREDYSTPTSGGLKLKGAQNGGIDKKRKKKKPSSSSSKPGSSSTAVAPSDKATTDSTLTATTTDNALADEDAQLITHSSKDREGPAEAGSGKTEAERRHEEMRRRRLDERLKREGIKTHKERVEELNKYLSALSEHHDMPRIGPG